jgi:type IV pilus assembly protein PilV
MKVYQQRGSSLIEVMVSLFILAVGLLGILAMQVKSIQFSQSADTYSRAMNLANDIAERIRINPKNVAAYASEAVPETAPTNCKTGEFTAACSAADLVKWDLFSWGETVKNTLPAGTGNISLKTQGSKNYLQVIVSFDDSRSNGTAGAARKQYTLLVESPTQLGGA